jgi:hypothetical protein
VVVLARGKVRSPGAAEQPLAAAELRALYQRFAGHPSGPKRACGSSVPCELHDNHGGV